MISIEAVIFDLDGVLIDTEQVWNQARRELTDELGGRWRQEATRDMMGMSSPEWSAYMHDELGVPRPPQEISRLVVERLSRLYRRDLPLLPGAGEAVSGLAARWRLAVASSANRELIDLVLDLARLSDFFEVTVSSEEVSRGKPSPDVYLEAARRLQLTPGRCAAVEDSTTGIQSAVSAGMAVITIPNPHFPPPAEALAQADAVLDNLHELVPEVIEAIAASH